MKTQLMSALTSRFGKVFVSGIFGGLAQLISYGIVFYPLIEMGNLQLFPERFVFHEAIIHPRFLLAHLLAIETGTFVSFYINNVWGFRDHALSGRQLVVAYIKTHVVIAGAATIQVIIGQALAATFGLGILRNIVYQGIGILVAFCWNYYFYKKLIWKVGQARPDLHK